LPITAWKELETPGNCDLYVIDGAPKKWQVRKIFNGETGKECDIDPIAHIVRPTFASLPEPPPALESI